MASVADYLRLVRFSHTLFALPFALGSFALACRGLDTFPWSTLGWVLGAMVGMRSAAMGFNRWVDAGIDARNPRTASREIPRGAITRTQALVFVAVSSALFFLSAKAINTLAFQLSPIAYVVALGYSLCKRFTSLAHAVLGLALAIAPVGAWIAVRGRIEEPPLWMALIVLLWTTGFDIIYATMDAEFDRREGLHSIPAKLGIPASLIWAQGLHLLMGLSWLALVLRADLGVWGVASMVLAVILVALEHRMVRPGDPGRMNLVFFKINAVVSVLFMTGAILESCS
ncbi:MAG: UbiA-like polyprenyltransferase [Planctomycetota bacterium]